MESQDRKEIVIQRLTALWALTESGLGGMLHAFQFPFTGLFVGGLAMMIITMIAQYARNPWVSILKALTVVLIVKVLVSPHSSPGAYLAVGFQGLLGAVLYTLFRVNALTVGILFALGMAESALQKIITLTILFGNSIWDAVDQLGLWIAKQLPVLSFAKTSTTLILIYLSIFLFAGLILSRFMMHILHRI